MSKSKRRDEHDEPSRKSKKRRDATDDDDDWVESNVDSSAAVVVLSPAPVSASAPVPVALAQTSRDELDELLSSGMSRTPKAERRFLFNDPGSGASSRSSSFRRPAGYEDSSPSTPLPARRAPAFRGEPSRASTPTTAVPTVTPARPDAQPDAALNQLQAKVLRAKLLGDPGARALEEEYERLRDAALSPSVRVLPTLNARGQLYDIGARESPQYFAHQHQQQRAAKKMAEMDETDTSVAEMMRQERFSGGKADQKDFDAQLGLAIMTDARFQNNLEYLDDNADKLGRKKMRTDAMKRMFAIQDYGKTQKALASCLFCFGEHDEPPRAPMVALGTRCYLSCTTKEELVPGHCLIVPMQHHLSMLDGDDDMWDEVQNFMKCLMRMFAAEDKGVFFYETVLSLRQQLHTVIECVPVPWAIYEDLPAYFRESILGAETEWAQHKKLIDFSARPGGFRRAMVPNLPYFMVQWDYKGERGYGHVIEGVGEAAGDGDDGVDEGAKGSGQFPRWFAAEIIGNIIDVPPRLWRNPKKFEQGCKGQRVAAFKKKYDAFDWTSMLE